MQVGIKQILDHIRMADYLSVAQLFLQDNFLLERPLTPEDIKPRLLGHWGTCHGINVAYAYLDTVFGKLFSARIHSEPENRSQEERKRGECVPSLIVGPGHGFPALQANLFLSGDLAKVDKEATLDAKGLAYLCKNFSWPYGFPSHSSPATPGVILEGGELGYSLATAYGASLGCPEKFIACLIGDGELETGTALASLNIPALIGKGPHGTVLPILHLNGYKISAPTITGRKSERELLQLLRGFGFSPTIISPDLDPPSLLHYLQGLTLSSAKTLHNNPPFLIMKTAKGATGPTEWQGEKIAGNYLSHQIPLLLAKTDPAQLAALESWLKSYHFKEVWHGLSR